MRRWEAHIQNRILALDIPLLFDSPTFLPQFRDVSFNSMLSVCFHIMLNY